MGEYTTKGKNLKNYLYQVWESHNRFSYFNILQIPKGSNIVADRLARVASRMDESVLPWEVEQKVIEVPSIGWEVNGVELREPDWAREIEKYQDTGELPINK